jgi:hypothetical protein
MNDQSAQRQLGLGDEPESAAFGFGSADDALDFGRHCAENAKDWAAAQKVDFVERYCQSKAAIVMKLASRTEAREYDLVIFAVPSGNEDASALERSAFEVHAASVHADGNDGCMKRATELIEGPDGIIPSFVRLERAKERHDLIRNVLTHFSCNVEKSEKTFFEPVSVTLTPL